MTVMEIAAEISAEVAKRRAKGKGPGTTETYDKITKKWVPLFGLRCDHAEALVPALERAVGVLRQAAGWPTHAACDCDFCRHSRAARALLKELGG